MEGSRFKPNGIISLDVSLLQLTLLIEKQLYSEAKAERSRAQGLFVFFFFLDINSFGVITDHKANNGRFLFAMKLLDK